MAWAVIFGLLTVGVSVYATYGQGTAGQPQQPKDQPMPQQQGRMDQETMQYSPKLIDANKLIGKDVRNRQGQDLGQIEDVVLDPSRQRISYAVLSFGGLLGVGDKYFAVPWDALTIPTGDEPVVFDVTKEQLQNAPGFDKNSWPSAADPQWRRSTQYWHQQRGTMGRDMGKERTGKTEPGKSDMGKSEPGKSDAGKSEWGKRTGEAGEEWGMEEEYAETSFEYRKLTQVIGLPVRDYRGEQIGDLENVMIDATRGQIAYAIIGHGGFLDMGQKLTPVPWSAVEINAQMEVARVATDEQTLERLALSEDQFSRLSEPDFANRLHREFGQEPYWVTYGYVSPGGAPRGESFDAWRPGSPYNRQFQAGEVQNYTGTIIGIGTFKPQRGAADGLRLRIRTDQGQAMTVHVGPWAYAQQQGFSGCQFGQKATVTGSRATVDGREVLIATKIESGGKTVELRDEKGQPKWDVNQLQSSAGMTGQQRMRTTGETQTPRGTPQRTGPQEKQDSQ